MDPVSLMAIIGLLYVVRDGFRFARRSRSAAAASPARRPGGRYKGPRWAGGRGHTGSGWWLSEAGHGFPVTRQGLAHGWRTHQMAQMRQSQQAAKSKITYAQARRDHQRLMDEAAAELAKTSPPKPAATPGPSVMAPPSTPAAGSTPRSPAAGPASNGNGSGSEHMAAPGEKCTNPGCDCHKDSQPANQASANGGAPTMSGAGTVAGQGDVTYESTEALIKQIIQAAENAVDGQMVNDARQHADQLGPMLPDDPETVGHISEAAQALADAQAKAKEAGEHAEAAAKSHAAHAQASKEAADAQGGAPEREYVTNG